MLSLIKIFINMVYQCCHPSKWSEVFTHQRFYRCYSMRMLSFQWMSFKCNFFREDVSHYEVIIISWSVTLNNCAFKRKCTRGLMYRPARIKVRISGNNPIFFYFIQTMTQENDQPNLRTLFWCWPIIHDVHKETRQSFDIDPR